MRWISLIVVGLVVSLAASTVEAQTRSGGRHVNPAMKDANKVIRDRLQPKLEKFGLQKNKRVGPGAANPANSAPDNAARYSRFDRNSDGYISRKEYFAARGRAHRVGAAGNARRRAVGARLNSRFRAADRNRDGRISTDELNNIRNSRF